MQPRISSITPSFNQGRYLEENILSVINQHYPNVEHIIIDGGSTDSTKEVLEKYKDKLAYVVSEPDKGQSDAVNKGFAKATGDIIGWLNSDDYYADGAFKSVIKIFNNNTINVVAGHSMLFDGKGYNKDLKPTVNTDKGLEYHLRFPYINQPGMFFRKEAMNVLMPVNALLHYAMDRELWIKYLLSFGIKQASSIENIIAYFRVHKDSKSTTAESAFDSESATIFHSFALKQNMVEIAKALEENYNIIKGYVFSFNPFPDEETTLNLVRYFFLQRAYQVYTEADFAYVKKMYPLLHFNNFTPLPEEEKALKEVSRIQKHINWTHFRLVRKYNHLFPHTSVT